MTRPLPGDSDTEAMLLGDEAVALGALHAGLWAAYSYPGAPSTEILECLRERLRDEKARRATWCANEKTAYEQALGVSMVGRRALVAMKHVGLNVAADPFVSSAVASIDGGLVVAVADDPGMHSSQNEQDSRVLAGFARVPCLEPADAQQAYDMTRQAFDLSERFRVPVLLRLVARVAHGRQPVRFDPRRRTHGPPRIPNPSDWILLPAFARRLWRRRLERWRDLSGHSDRCEENSLWLDPAGVRLGVITAGIARDYYLENLEDLKREPSHLHIGLYPLPSARIRALARHVDRVLVLEEGYPHVEGALRGMLPGPTEIMGRESGHLPLDGELTPDLVRVALGLPPHRAQHVAAVTLPRRTPQLCRGCPHADAYEALNRALEGSRHAVITNDIGCYALGVLPPHSCGRSCICMGASIGMAKGAVEAGVAPAVAVVGDSTFLHSGVTGLMDAVAADTDMTVLILDNQTVAMTGTQPTLLSSSGLRGIALGLGVDPMHCHQVRPHPGCIDELETLLRREIAHRGLSVVIVTRECLEKARRRRAEEVR